MFDATLFLLTFATNLAEAAQAEQREAAAGTTPPPPSSYYTLDA